ncbi:MAG: tRNA (adenosine(37)-N6)-threonylcarbamoyltransferase complex transferase subunit TsaD [Saccharofermentanales bacterium]
MKIKSDGSGPILCLGIESSCDETAAAVVLGGRTVLSNVIASQIDLHREYGGVVPEIASRLHVEAVLPVIDSALKESGRSLEEIDLIAVTHGPGLIGALLVGLCAAKGLAFTLDKPFVGVNHIEGHILANLIDHPELEPPFITLVVSGGHSHIIKVHHDYSFEVVARTRDDAAGEAFDKIARECGLGYPGGPLIDKTSTGGNPLAIRFPRTRFPDGSLDFSFSGVKTAALNYLNNLRMKAQSSGLLLEDILNYPDFTASFQHAIIEVLADHTFEAASKYSMSTVCIAGGVSANRSLRSAMKQRAEAQNIRLYIPSPVYCTDNAAMIACAGTFSYLHGRRDGPDLNAFASLDIEKVDQAVK